MESQPDYCHRDCYLVRNDHPLRGVANNFVQLLPGPHVGVGIGEAGSAPASHSLLADLFPAGASFRCAWHFGNVSPDWGFYGLCGRRLDYRTSQLACGLSYCRIARILVAVAIWITVKDPRGNVPLSAAFKTDPDKPKLLEALRELSAKPAYWHLVAAGVLVQFVSYGLASFYGGLFVRVYGIGYGELGWKLGVMVGLSGGFGAWFGGKTGDILGKRNPKLPLLISGLVLVIAAPGMIWAVYAGDVNLAIALLSFPTFAATFYYGPSFATIQTLASDQTRAMAVAIYLLIAGLIGLGLGPVFVGLLSDAFLSDPELNDAGALQRALTCLALFNIWAGFHYWRAEARMVR